MPRNVRLSRLNPVYLARRHAGVFLLILALGVAGGVVYQAVLTPRVYESGLNRAFAVVPPAAAAGFDWDARAGEWIALMANRETRALYVANLRAAVKRAAAGASGRDWSSERLRAELLAFRTPKTYSTAPASGRFHPYVGPGITVARHDIAANLDFQSLAAVVADLDPTSGTANWDLHAYGEKLHNLAALDQIVVDPGPGDPHFRVFYRLHALLNGGAEASTPAEAWATAVSEVGARIVREFEFQGGGGFGAVATRELLQEIDAIPLLAANTLYRAAGSLYGDDESTGPWEAIWRERLGGGLTIRVEHDGAVRGRLDIAMRSELHPFIFPVDSPMTRIVPLEVRTLFAFVEAWEKNRTVTVPAPPPSPEAVVEEPPPSPPPAAEEKKPADSETAEREAEAARLEAEAAARALRLSRLEADLHAARLRRDEAARRLEAARIASDQVSGEATGARGRADRLKERLEAAELLSACPAPPPEQDPGLAILLGERESLLRYLAVLLQYCTEEHPFVVQARRELAALDSRLALLAPPPAEPKPDPRETRLLNLRAESEAAEANAANLAERLRRSRAEAERRLAELSDAERNLADREFAFASERDKATPRPADAAGDLSQSIGLLADRLSALARDNAERPAEPPPKPDRVVVISRPPETRDARVSFSSLPDLLPLAGSEASNLPLCAGAAAGLALGLLWVLMREVLTFRPDSPYVARRLVDLPLLAVLPAYDQRSLLAAAKAEEGKLMTQAGRRAYLPESLDLREPPSLGKRKPIRPLGRRRRILPWILAALVMLLAVAAQQGVARGWFTPAPPFADEVWRRPLPAQAPQGGEEGP